MKQIEDRPTEKCGRFNLLGQPSGHTGQMRSGKPLRWDWAPMVVALPDIFRRKRADDFQSLGASSHVGKAIESSSYSWNVRA